MADEEITVGTVNDGPDTGEDVTLPVLDVLTGRGFVTGKSGSGKSNSASVIAENLLDRGYALLVVDIDGEYYGLKEKYEILHVGGDEECDILVGPEHAEKIATLALENNIPIILDVSSYLDEGKAAELLTEVAKQLFAKEKKLKKPFLLIIEEVHEYIPEGGGLDECGRMLIKIGKRGRKHGLGITGISQRPADVKKDFITQCDWLCWHRLTWKNDTQVVRRVLDAEYAEAVESLDDGEAFVRSDWAEDVRRVQFDRKQTFDAGATPGLDDFERPDLKSVSSDLVSELEQISEAENRREEEIERLKREQREKEKRIEKLEQDLADARDLSRMADQFATALFDHTGRSRSQLEFEQQTLDDYPEMPFPNLNSVDIDISENGETNDDESKNKGSDKTETSQIQHEQVEREKGKKENEEEREEEERTEAEKCDENREHEVQDENTFDQSIVERLRNDIESLDSVTREMLARYRVDGPLSPMDAYTRAGGSGDRMKAYWRNSTLRRANLITHAGRGQYAYALSDIVTDCHDEQLTPEDIEKCVARIESSLLPISEQNR
jgi:ribosomal protein S25